MKELYRFEKGLEDGSKLTVVLKRPTQRELEDAEVEYSVALSSFIRKGILTKTMLIKQYADMGGVLPENVAKEQSARYERMYQIQFDIAKIDATPESKKTKKEIEEDRALRTELFEELDRVRREAINVENLFEQVYNHTAEKKAETRLILWWLHKMLYVQSESDKAPSKVFFHESYDDNQELMYEFTEEEGHFFNQIREKVVLLISYWFNNENIGPDELKEFDERIESLISPQEEIEEDSSELTEVVQEEQPAEANPPVRKRAKKKVKKSDV